MAGIPVEDESRGWGEDPVEGIPFVRMGSFQEGKSGEDPGSSAKGCAVQGCCAGYVSSGVKLGLHVRSEDASNCALVHSSGRVSVFVVRAGFFLICSAYSQILPSLSIQTCHSS